MTLVFVALSLSSVALISKITTKTFAYKNCPSVSCGNTAREKYWLALGKYFDNDKSGNIHRAGILGNMYTEGNYNPVAWQGYIGIDSSGNFAVSWDTLYNHSYNSRGDNNVVGVGSVGITWDLSVYLHYVNDNAPDLLEKYFKDPVNYSFNYMYHESSWVHNDTDGTYGDEALAKIGATDFDRLVELEVKYAMENQKPSTVESYMNREFSSPSDAASWWATYYEVGADYQNPSATRLRNAEKAYDDFNDRDFAAECNSEVISQYVIDSNNKYLELTDFKDNITGFENLFAQSAYSVDVDTKTVDGKQIPYTGGKTKLYRNETLVETYTNIVRGDTNGDGIIGIQDYIEIRKDIMDDANGLKNEYRVAGDIDKNNLITIVDYTRIRKILMR